MKTENHDSGIDDFEVRSGNLLYAADSSTEKRGTAQNRCARLFFVTCGEGTLTIAGHIVTAQASCLAVINPKAGLPEPKPAVSGMEYLEIGVGGLTFSLPGETSQWGMFHCGGYQDELLFFLRTMAYELNERNAQYEKMCTHLLEAFLVLLTRATGCVPISAGATRTSRECSAAKRYIDQNYTTNITLDLLAELTHMNKFYLVHAFQRYLGMSPINYLNSRRIEESKQLLRETNRSVSDIAFSVGFSSQSYFSQAFQKSAGESPGSYRKRMKATALEAAYNKK